MTVIHELSREHARRAGRSVVAVARGTYQDRYRSARVVEFDAARPANRLTQRLEAVGGALGRPRTAGARLFAPGLAALSREAGVGALLVHNGPAAGWVLPGPRSGPSALYCHNDLFQTYSRSELRRLGARWSHILCVSDFIAERIVSRSPELESKVHVVMNGVDTDIFSMGPRQAEQQHSSLRVLAFGRIQPAKGMHVLIEAAQRLNGRDVKIDIVGSSGFDASAALTPYEQQLRTAAAVTQGSITFRPFQPRVAMPDLLRQYDVLVVPSTFDDPCPLALLEGMATGLAVVASHVGGMPQVLGKGGLTFPVGDSGALAAILVRLEDDRPRTRLWGAAARERALSLTWRDSYDALSSALA